jgi:hypothetical protein
MTRRARALWLGLALGAASGTVSAGRAHAYDFSIDLRTIGQGYQVRRFGAAGNNELLSRRRLTQYLDLSVMDLMPARYRGDDLARNHIYFDASLRFESDFGGYLLGRPTGTDSIGELKQSQLDILYAFVGGRNVGGRVDFQLGRQMHFDLIDFYAFDGGDVIVKICSGFSAQAFAGTEVRGELPLSAPIYELDGTSAGARDPVTRPGQNKVWRPLAGAALAAGGQGRPWALRLAYRRVWSSTADRLPGEPAAGVNDEKLGLTGNWSWQNRVMLYGGMRLNLLLAAFDDEQVALRVRLRERQWVTLEGAYLAPTFDGDSIWNVFASGAYGDVRASYELGLGPEVKTYARGFLRVHEHLGEDAPGGRHAFGGSLGAAWRRGRGMLRADSYGDGGFGGRKLGLDLAARWAVRPQFELEGRLTGYMWRNDLNPENGEGVVMGAQAGGRYQLGPGLRLHILAEDNFGTYYKAQFRGLAIVEMDASI